MKPKTGYLVLQNGKVFRGERFGADGDTIAEIVFQTGMIGYIETLTDKSYYGQAVVQTFPQIGNYGVISADFDGDMIGPRAYIVKNWCQTPSNFRSEGDIDAFLSSRGVVGLSGIDTRTLIKILRTEGSLNGAIVDDPDGVDFEALRGYKTEGAAEAVSVEEVKRFGIDGASKTVALLDFGYSTGIVSAFNKRGCNVIVCPAMTTFQDISKMGVDGIILSTGPGNPAESEEIISNIKEITGMGIPVFGVGLGHQLAAIACGMKTVRLPYGHHGGQPVRYINPNDSNNGRVYTACHNHGYAVAGDSIDKSVADEIFVSAVDGTNEGLEYKNKKMITVQFNPCGGAEDTQWVVDRFIDMMDGGLNI